MEFPRFQPSEVDELVDLLASEEWPFHANSRVDADTVRRRVADGGYDNAAERTFWIADGAEKLGLVRLMDLDDGTPLFDLRIRAAHRGRGIGTAAVAWLTNYVFTTFPELNRIEGTTRQDNQAMRRAFRRTGYVKEAHYRESWPAPDGNRDAIGYAILRRDWENGTVTAPDWDDEQRT